MTAEEFAKVCFALRPVLIVAGVVIGVLVLMKAWKEIQRPLPAQGGPPETEIPRAGF